MNIEWEKKLPKLPHQIYHIMSDFYPKKLKWFDDIACLVVVIQPLRHLPIECLKYIIINLKCCFKKILGVFFLPYLREIFLRLCLVYYKDFSWKNLFFLLKDELNMNFKFLTLKSLKKIFLTLKYSIFVIKI